MKRVPPMPCSAKNPTLYVGDKGHCFDTDAISSGENAVSNFGEEGIARTVFQELLLLGSLDDLDSGEDLGRSFVEAPEIGGAATEFGRSFVGTPRTR